MIENRPASLAANPLYGAMPEGLVSVDTTSLPEILRLDLDNLSGIQPITATMARAARDELRDDPSPGEIELYREQETAFQLVFIVFNRLGLRLGSEEDPAVGVHGLKAELTRRTTQGVWPEGIPVWAAPLAVLALACDPERELGDMRRAGGCQGQAGLRERRAGDCGQHQTGSRARQGKTHGEPLGYVCNPPSLRT